MALKVMNLKSKDADKHWTAMYEMMVKYMEDNDLIGEVEGHLSKQHWKKIKGKSAAEIRAETKEQYKQLAVWMEKEDFGTGDFLIVKVEGNRRKCESCKTQLADGCYSLTRYSERHKQISLLCPDCSRTTWTQPDSHRKIKSYDKSDVIAALVDATNYDWVGDADYINEKDFYIYVTETCEIGVYAQRKHANYFFLRSCLTCKRTDQAMVSAIYKPGSRFFTRANAWCSECFEKHADEAYRKSMALIAAYDSILDPKFTDLNCTGCTSAPRCLTRSIATSV